MKSVLIIVKNYTGDVLHFGLARERWAASHPGSNDVRLLVVGDDVAVPRSAGKLTGRKLFRLFEPLFCMCSHLQLTTKGRGLASTVLVYKISGALAAKGATLDEVEHLAKIVSERSATIGVGLEHCQVPGTEKSEAHLGDDEIEIGMGESLYFYTPDPLFTDFNCVQVSYVASQSVGHNFKTTLTLYLFSSTTNLETNGSLPYPLPRSLSTSF